MISHCQKRILKLTLKKFTQLALCVKGNLMGSYLSNRQYKIPHTVLMTSLAQINSAKHASQLENSWLALKIHSTTGLRIFVRSW